MNWYKKSLKYAARNKSFEIAGITGIYGGHVETISDYVRDGEEGVAHSNLGEQHGTLGRFLYNDIESCHWYYILLSKTLAFYSRHMVNRIIKQGIKDHLKKKYNIVVEKERDRFD